MNLISDEEFDDTVILDATVDDLTALGLKRGAVKKMLSAIDQIKTGEVYKCFKCFHTHFSFEKLYEHLNVVHNLQAKDDFTCLHCCTIYTRNSFYKHMKGFFRWHNKIIVGTRPNDEESHVVEIDCEEIRPSMKYVTLKELERKALNFACGLLASGKLPISTYEKIIKDVKIVLTSIVDNCADLCRQLEANHLLQETTISKILEHKNVFDSITTKYKVDKKLNEMELLTIPKEIVLDTDLVSRKRGENSVQVYKKCAMQFVPIGITLQKILKNSDLSKISPKTSGTDGVFKFFGDGSYFHKRDSHHPVIFINIYYDDIEVVNPLGTKTGTHKLAQFYFSIVDLLGSLNSSPNNMFFLASLKSDDMKLAGANSVLRPLEEELQELCEKGLIIQNQLCYVYLCQIVGDNLGIHTLLGFSEGFMANFPCRRCNMHKNECKSCSSENKDLIRTKESYNNDLEKNCFSSTGIKFDSVLNELPYFHVVNNVSFDIMHDLLGGVVPDFLRNMLTSFITDKFISLNQLNHRIESFNYGPHYSKTKPTFFKAGFLKGDVQSNQYSSQVSCLLICLPIIIGDLIPQDNNIWELFILLREIYNLLMSIKITSGQIMELNSYITEFLNSYQDIFKIDLKPKHHHLLHYGTAIKAIGPLKQFWSMIYEARHKFFKNVMNAAGNFKNVPKTVSYRYQLLLAYRLLSNDDIISQEIFVKDCEVLELKNCKHSRLLKNYFDGHEFDLVECMEKIKINNNEYKFGCIITFYDGENVNFGKIVTIYKIQRICFVVRKLGYKYSEHFMAYEIEDTEEIKCVNPNDLCYYLPLYYMISFDENSDIKYVSLASKL